MIQIFAMLLIASQPQPVSIDDLQWLPSHDQALSCYYTVCAERITTIKPEVWHHAFPEHYAYYNWVEFKYKVWGLMSDAQLAHYPKDRKENCLQELRELIGAEAYYNGRLPY